ncbi:MAG TPA: trigger factor [Verrucomicrobiae bacterium]|nr:trigger factor [Verrucomicrobiae bacterium]
MNVTVENLGPCKKLMRVEVGQEKVEETFKEVAGEFQREARLPGFRPGKAPKEIVAKRFESDIQDQVKRRLISDSFKAAIAEHKLSIVGQPEVEEIQFNRGQALQFAANLEIAPEFQLPEYKGLSATREAGSVTPEDVERALRVLTEHHAKFPTVTREIKEGDIAVVNYTGTCDGKPILETAPTATGLTEKKAFWITVDKTSFIPGFGEQLIGMKAGEKRTITVDFPADFVVPQLIGKKGVYEVELVEVKEKGLPAIDEEFAKAYGAESLEKLREGVRADLQNELNLKQSRSIRNQVVQNLLNQIQCDLPESMVEDETRNIVYSIVNEQQQRGVLKDAIDAQKDQIYGTANTAARQRVKASFVFRDIAEKEGVRVEQVEIGRRLQDMAAQYKVPFDKLVKDMEKSGRLNEIYNQILSEKVVDLLVQFAKIQDVAPAPKM